MKKLMKNLFMGLAFFSSMSALATDYKCDYHIQTYSSGNDVSKELNVKDSLTISEWETVIPLTGAQTGKHYQLMVSNRQAKDESMLEVCLMEGRPESFGGAKSISCGGVEMDKTTLNDFTIFAYSGEAGLKLNCARLVR